MAKYQKITFFLCTILLISFHGKAQKITTFQKSFGGTSSEYGCALVALPDKGFILGGITNSFGSGGYDILLVRTDSLGKRIWARTYGGTSDEGVPYYIFNSGVDMVLTPDSNIVVCSNTKSYGAGGTDVYLYKIDLNGNAIWSKTFGGTSNDYGYGIVNDPNGGFMIAGETFSYGPGNGDVFLIKTDAGGGLVWAKAYGSSSYEEAALQIKNSKDGNFLLSGYSLGSSNGQDEMIMKVDENGKLLFNKVYGTSSDESAVSVIDLPDSSIYTSGGTSSYIASIFSKYDKNGNLKWCKMYDQNQHIFTSNILYDPAKKVFNTVFIKSGPGHMGIMRSDTSGKVIFTKIYGPIIGSGYYTDGTGSYMAQISSGFALNYTTSVFGAGSTDFFFAKVDTSASNSNSCYISPETTSVLDFTSSIGNHTYSFTTSSANPQSGSGMSSASANVKDSFLCTPFVASFNLPNTCVGQKAQFYDSSYYNPVSWSWNFGDAGSSSNTSNLRNPTHTYSNSGSYKVTLTSSSSSETDNVSRTLTIYPLPVIAPWAQNATKNTVSFVPQDTSIGKFKWYFGDPDSDSSPNKEPTFTYPPGKGKYLVKLFVTSKYGCVSEKTDSVLITNSGINLQKTNADWIQIFPNPFSGITNINYTLESPGKVNITIYDLTGKQVAELKNGMYAAASYSEVFDATKCHCPQGVYILKMTVNDEVYTARIENMR